jgi:hypothetical protein
MSVNLRAIHIPPAPAHPSPERTRERDPRDPREDFATLLEQGVATPAGTSRRPGTAATPTVPTISDEGDRSVAGGEKSGGNRATEGNQVTSRGTLSTDPRTLGMYIPPDFYHGTSYSPVFDQQDENGNWVPTPRFAGQQIWGPWRGSKPDDWDPNARVEHDPLLKEQGHYWWKKDDSGNWVKRETGYGGIPLNDDGKPMFTPDPVRFPEYFVSSPDDDEEA